MIIDIKQITSEKKNEFEILINNQKKYMARLPFININGSFNLEKLRDIKLLDLNGDLKYKSEYNYISNQIEEFIPLKYLITNSQKFNQYKFVDHNNNLVSEIYFEQTELSLGYIVLKINNKFYPCYSVSDGYINHICIYNDNLQVGELLKSNVVIDTKDSYRVYLKDDYGYLSDVVSLLALYLDRFVYNSSWIKNKSQVITYEKSYSKVNSYYDKDWLLNNFNCGDYIDNINKQALEVKNNVKKQIKKLFIIMEIVWVILIIIIVIILAIVL